MNKEKCILKATSIPYFGHILSGESTHPDPNKVKAIHEMPLPKSREQLQTLLGMLNYLSWYIPNLSTQNEQLRLLQKQKVFIWTPDHEQVLQQLKESTCRRVASFKPTCSNIELQVDASKSGLGAILLQNNSAVSYASRSLTNT